MILVHTYVNQSLTEASVCNKKVGLATFMVGLELA